MNATERVLGCNGLFATVYNERYFPMDYIGVRGAIEAVFYCESFEDICNIILDKLEEMSILVEER